MRKGGASFVTYPDDHRDVAGTVLRAVKVQYQVLLANPGKHQIALDHGVRLWRDRGLTKAGRNGREKRRSQDARLQGLFLLVHICVIGPT